MSNDLVALLREQIAHVKDNANKIRAFDGLENEARCRELAAVYLTDLIEVIQQDSRIAALTAQPNEQVHSDHPMRHYDRTCPACNGQPSSVMVPVDEHRALMHLLECAKSEFAATPKLVNAVRGYYLHKAATEAAAKEPK